jgi:dihydroorotate dehydrogenase
MACAERLPRYDRRQTYEWNYDHAPSAVEIDVPAVPGNWSFCGLPAASPLGIAAGPLLNGRWCLYYASLGFDVVTYKTVRSQPRTCYPLPNLQPVACDQLHGGETNLPVADAMRGSWAVSFGMPSKAPDVWRRDVEETRKHLAREKVLSVSVVGTIQEGWTIEDLAEDYARCATWAVECGADAVETNFSCPNVTTCDGQIYQQPRDAAIVAERVRAAIGDVPFLIKIGHVTSVEEADALLDAVAAHADALSMTNSIAATVTDTTGQLLFDGEKRGICGAACRTGSIEQTALFARVIRERRLDVQIVGVGGVANGDHLQDYLQAGAHAVHLATAAMMDPLVGVAIKRRFSAVQCHD